MERLIPTPESLDRSFWLWSNPQYFAWQFQTDKESLWVLVDAVSKCSQRHSDRLQLIVRDTTATLERLQPREMVQFMLAVVHNLFEKYDEFKQF
jgi:hypothetical protein